MALLAVLPNHDVARGRSQVGTLLKAFGGLLLLALATLCVHGYHPHSDDAALYVAGIKHLYQPALYSSVDRQYIEVQAGASVFEPLMAGLIRAVGGHVDGMLFAAYLATTMAFLAGVYRLARLLFPLKVSAMFACVLSAAAFTLPVAGTSLALMDPYLTARSFSTPLALFAIEALLSGALVRSAVLTVFACLFHPLMGCCLVLFETVLFIFLRVPRERRTLWLAAFAGTLTVLFAGADVAAWLHPVGNAYRAVVWTRSYVFLREWEPYEYPGIVAPILMAGYALRHARSPRIRGLLAAILASGCILTLLCLFFVEPTQSLLLARLQTLRIFQPIYLVGVVLVGGWLGCLHARGRRSVLLFPAAAAVALFCAQLFIYQGNSHLETPGRAQAGQWHLAFLWIRDNTPQTAVFAADPHMIEVLEEDREGFRATAERSILADDKDGGVATLSPSLAAVWTSQYRAQVDLARASDPQRRAQLAPFGVTWLLLPASAHTEMPCPFHNAAVQVCQL